MSGGAPAWIAYARSSPPAANTHTPGQPNNYREKMAAYGVHDQSALTTKYEEGRDVDSTIEKKDDAEQAHEEGDGEKTV